ncbi:MAG: hypothetical protein MJ109_07345 [Kiritimatiellae bacterium]|nr:hypothetical protein [Kiritimatiellia bacterium]
MNIADAKDIYSSFVNFANQDLRENNGDLRNANAVARLNGRTVSAANDDAIHKFTRGAEQKNFNISTHKAFKDSIVSLFGKENVSELPANVQKALQTISSDKRPLSARRIHIISSEVNIALMSEKGENTVTDQLKTMGSAINTVMKDSRDLGKVKANLQATFAAISSDAAALNDEFVSGIISSINEAIDGATSYGDLCERLNAKLEEITNSIDNANLESGSSKCAAAYGLKQVASSMAEELKKSAYLAKIDTIRANIASLKTEHAKEPEVLNFLNKLERETSNEHLAQWGFAEFEIDRLEMLASKDYINVVNKQITEIVKDTIDAEKALLQAFYDMQGDKTHDELMPESMEGEIKSGLETEAKAAAWNRQVDQGEKGIDTKNIGEAFRTSQGQFVKDVHDKIKSDVTTAVKSEKDRVDEGAKKLNLTFISEEDEKKFIADMCEKYAKLAWNQTKTIGKVELPIAQIEDAYAAEYSKGFKTQSDEIITGIVSELKNELENVRTKSSDELSKLVSNDNKLTLNAQNKLNEDQSTLKELQDQATRERTEISNLQGDIEVMESTKKNLENEKIGWLNFGRRIQRWSACKKIDKEINIKSNDLKVKNDPLKLKALNNEIKEKTVVVESKQNTLDEIDKQHKEATEKLNDFIDKTQTAIKDLEKAKESIDQQFSSSKTIDLSSLKVMLDNYKAESNKISKTLKDFKLLAKSNDVAVVAKPESFKVYSRFGLHDPENFTRRVEIGSKSFLKGLVNASELSGAEKATLGKVLDNTFGNKASIPEKFVNIGLNKLEGQTDESLAKLEIENGLELYVKCVIDGVKSGTVVLDGEKPLPSLEDTAIKNFEEAELARDREANRGSKIPALGNDRKYKGAINVLKNFGTEGANLAQELEKLLPLFNKSASSSKFSSAAFDKNYMAALTAKIGAEHKISGGDVRGYFVKLLIGIERNNDASDLDASATVIGNAKQLVKLMGAMVEEAEKEAEKKTLDSLKAPIRALVGFNNMTTLDKEDLIMSFLKKTGLSEEEFSELDSAAVTRIRSFMPFVDTAFAKKRSFATEFIRSLAANDFPVSLLNPDSKALVEGLVSLKLASDTDEGLVQSERQLISGFGTYNAGEILKGLSQDGLLNLKGGKDTARIVSLLHAINGGKAGGLNQVADEAFQKGISEISKKEYKAVLDKVADNKKGKLPLLFTVGKYSIYEDNKAGFNAFIASSNKLDSVLSLLEGGIEPLFAKNQQPPDVSKIREWINAMNYVDAPGGTATIKLKDVDITLTHLKNGNIEATLKGDKNEIVKKYLAITPKAIVSQMQETIFRHADTIVTKAPGELSIALKNAKPSDVRRYSIMIVKAIAASKKYGQLDSVKLAGMSSAELRNLAEALIENRDMGMASFLSMLKLDSNLVYSQEVTDSLARLEAFGKDKVDSLVKTLDVTTPIIAPSKEKMEVINAEMQKLQDEFTTHFVNSLSSPRASTPDMTSLKELAGTESIDMTSGYGAFLKKMMTNYFTKMSELDKRVLFAAVKNETGAESTYYQRIASLVKNSGPVFVKMLQGIPAGAVSNEFKNLMSEIKDSLPHISTDIVRSQLLDIIERSNGQITGIEVKESLGAASVGEALLCRIKTLSNPDGEDVVIKLLRPNVQTYAQREIDFIHNVLNDTSFDGRLEGILKELDLTQEAENVATGRAYDTIQPPDPDALDVSMNRIVSMQLHPIARPSVMTAIIRKAPGITCEKFFKGVEKKLEETLAPFKHGKHYKTGSINDFVIAKDELLHLYGSTKTRQQDLVRLAYKWGAYALFPKDGGEGFVHGDLHDGNIMTSEREMTFIDFGNAMKLSDDERKSLICSLVYCGIGKTHGGDFLKQLEGLGLKVEKTVDKDAVIADLNAVFSKGTANDTGLRFAAAVKILQKHLIEIPAVVNNFAQSLLRLQNAIERANDSLRKIEGVLRGLKFDASLATEEEKKNPFRVDSYDNDATPIYDVDSEDALVLVGKPMDKFQYDMTNAKLEGLVADMCKGEDGKFSTLAVKEKLLKNLEPYKKIYLPSDEIYRQRPPLEDRDGFKVYQEAEELLKAEFDLDNDDDVAKFNKIVKDIAKDLAKVMVDVQNGIMMNTSAFINNVKNDPIQAFSVVFEECIVDHDGECRKAVEKKIGASAIFLINQLKESGKLSTAEQKAIERIPKINTKFMVKYPDFSIDSLRKTSDVVNNEFVHEFDTFGAKWGKNEKLLERGAKILAKNITHLKDSIPEDELKPALDLAIEHMMARFKLGDSFKSLAADQFEKFLSFVTDKDVKYVAEKLHLSK